MSTPSSTSVSPPIPSSRPNKMNRPSKIVTFKLPANLLSRFLPKPTPRKSSKGQSTPSSASTPNAAGTTLPVAQASSNGNASESNSTPAPSNDLPAQSDGSKKSGTKGPKLGTKRALGQGSESLSKPRGKPGPKKKPRLEDGTIDHGLKPTPGPVAPITTHKLGPKANQGAINAGLRALDRSGKPCRKWERKSFQLKSFTGVVWELPSWRTPKSQLQNGEESSDGKDASQQSSSNGKVNDSSTVAESNSGDPADPMVLSTPAASSPAPAASTISVQG